MSGITLSIGRMCVSHAIYRRRVWGRLSELTVGNLTHHDVAVVEGDKNALGLGFLARHIVTFDLARRKLCLKTGKLFDHPYTVDITGKHILLLADSAFTIMDVDVNSPPGQSTEFPAQN